MLVEVDGLQVDLIDCDDRQVIHLKDGDGYEHNSLVAWLRAIKPGTVVIDVGAYTGLYSIIAAKRGARVFAFEPMPANRWRLGVNLRENKVEVKVYDMAVSDRNGHAVLNYNPNVPLTTGASLESGIAAHSNYLKVPCTTLDALAFANVTAIKIDVERHELAVLRGAMSILRRDKPMLLIETLDTRMREEALTMLPNYSVAAILDKRNTMFVPKSGDTPCPKGLSQGPRF